MSAPRAPYCTSDEIAVLLHMLTRGAEDFSSETTPTKAAVDTFINKYAAWVNMAFARVGYVVPFEALTGEEWPYHQTEVLSLMNAFGVAGALSGPALKPAPAYGDQQGRSKNEYTATFDLMMAGIKQDGLGFRASFRYGKPAEKFVTEPSGPTTDFLEGYLDPTRYQTIGEFTALYEDLRSRYDIANGGLGWDHLYLHRAGL